MLSVDEGVLESQKMVIVVLVELGVELVRLATITRSRGRARLTRSSTETSIILWLK